VAHLSRRVSLELPFAARRRRAALALLSAVLAGAPAVAGPLGPPEHEYWQSRETVGVLDRVVLRVHWFESVAQLRAAASGRDVNPRDLRGFAVLSRDKDTGGYVCDVFVVKLGGSQVDDDRTVTFGHEVLHCLGLSHR